MGLLAVGLAGPRDAESCGPVFPRAQFHFYAKPPASDIVRGRLGIIRPSYDKRYLVVAYRYLAGVPLSKEEADAFSRQPPARPATGTGALGLWTAARAELPASADTPIGIDPYRRLDQFTVYQNCLDSAFEQAVATFEERKKRWGINSENLAEWMRGQSAVFDNCDGENSMPTPLPAGTDPLLLADRQYQVAAAAFYAQNYAAAEQGFQEIARDTASPWHEIAPYLLGRAFLRHATIGGDKTKLAAAANTLRSVTGKWQGPARRLLHHVQAQDDPGGRWVELCEELMAPESGPDFAQNLFDLAVIRNYGVQTSEQNNDLANWILTFEHSDWQFTVARWRESRSEPWLLAALSAIPKDHPDAAGLLAHARTIPRSSPGWTSAAYYGVSLEMARGNTAAARAWADQALRTERSADTRNSFLGARMRLARNWDEFLQVAARRPVAVTAYDNDEELNQQSSHLLFDDDFTDAMNQEVPLSRWVDAASNGFLTSPLQLQVARTAWVRAVILGRTEESKMLARRLAQLSRELNEAMMSYAAEPDAARARFDAVFLMLHYPGIQPVLHSGFERETPTARIDDFRDNWWDISPPEQHSGPQSGPNNMQHAWGLPNEERASGEKEWRHLKDLAPVGPDYLAAETIRWARAHPDDPRNPEALHLSVRAIRYGVGARRDPAISKQAFRLLHLLYPKSPWTTRTPYWY
ncbi:MAG: hypothetical protein C5B51_26045 [Terriglobia bacterium]|nr:MAG: hypothetical protein C5B51_26045 [Terriglobia bacterium]